MSDFHHESSRTGLLLVDPYNDFLSDGGKLWPMVKDVADEVGLLDHLRSILLAARQPASRSSSFPIAAGSRATTKAGIIQNPSQRSVKERQVFARGTWGGEWHPDFVPQAGDIIVKEHWAQSGFANTDLDFQLKQHGVMSLPSVCLPTAASSQPAASPWSWVIT